MDTDYSIRELSELTGRHPVTLRRLARLGKLPGAYRIGRTWVISRNVVAKLRQGELPKPTEGF